MTALEICYSARGQKDLEAAGFAGQRATGVAAGQRGGRWTGRWRFQRLLAQHRGNGHRRPIPDLIIAATRRTARCRGAARPTATTDLIAEVTGQPMRASARSRPRIITPTRAALLLAAICVADIPGPPAAPRPACRQPAPRPLPVTGHDRSGPRDTSEGGSAPRQRCSLGQVRWPFGSVAEMAGEPSDAFVASKGYAPGNECIRELPARRPAGCCGVRIGRCPGSSGAVTLHVIQGTRPDMAGRQRQTGVRDFSGSPGAVSVG